MAFCPIDSLSEVINKKRVTLVQLGVIVSAVVLVALSCGKTVRHGCLKFYNDGAYSWPGRIRGRE